MEKSKIKKVGEVVLLIIVFVFLYTFIKSDPYVPESKRIDDAQTVESFLKFNILTHDGMNLSDVTPNFSGRDKEWSLLASAQINNFLGGAPMVQKMFGDPYIFSYKLTYEEGRVVYIIWFDNGGDENIGADTTVDLDVSTMNPQTEVILTERLLGAGETEPLVRGYLIDDGGHTKITITSTPIFVYPQPL